MTTINDLKNFDIFAVKVKVCQRCYIGRGQDFHDRVLSRSGTLHTNQWWTNNTACGASMRNMVKVSARRTVAQ